MKLLYVDHAFHIKTKSTVFLSDVLAEYYDIDNLYLDPEKIDPETLILGGRYDVVILFQLDFLAPVFIAQGIRTIVVPMYDGSELMPDLHWIWMRAGGCINFSRRLHERTRRVGTPSFLAKYYPPPGLARDRPKFNNLRVFFWQRRPIEGVNLRLVEDIFGSQLTSLHLHNVPDDPSVDASRFAKSTRSDYKLTVSTWFKQKSDYEAALRSCNVFVASRLSEGIGQAFLEAMARGMLVLAPDGATHDEYIANWVNGVLFSPRANDMANFQGAASIAELGWRSVVDGYDAWINSRASIVSFVQDIPAPSIPAGIDPIDLARGLIRSYTNGLSTYTSYLMAHSRLISDMSGLDLTARVTDVAGYRTQSQQLREADREIPWLPQNRIVPTLANIDEYIVSGRRDIRGDTLWIENQHLSLKFALDLSLGVVSKIRLDLILSTSDETAGIMLCVSLNTWTITMRSIRASGVIELDLPPQAVERVNVLTIQTSPDVDAGLGAGSMPLGIRRCDFV